MTRILLTGISDSLNNGGMAMAISAANTLKKIIPDAEFSILSSHFDIDRRRYAPYGIKVIERTWRGSKIKAKKRLTRIIILASLALITLFNFVLMRIIKSKKNKLYTKSIGEFFASDIIIDINGDSLTEDYGFPMGALFEILLGIITGNPVVIYAQSIGPFKSKMTKFSAKFVFNRVSLITVREEITYKYMRELGIKTPVYLTAESAFLLEPASNESINRILSEEGIRLNEKPLIGISPSRIIYRYGFPDCEHPTEKYRGYIRIMAKITDYIIDKLNATVIFIPHVIASDNDDRVVSKDIYMSVRNKHKVKIITYECTADELKGLIGICDLFIGCRMHATIASTSMLVPTIAIAYSSKTHGIIGKMLGQEELVIDIRKLKSDELLSELKSKINYAYENRDSIRNNLREKIKMMRNLASLNGVLVKNLLARHQ